MTLLDAIHAAESRIRPYIRETPLELSLPLSERSGAEVWLKLENQQLTGSFKLRGALNKLLSLPAELRARGVVAASSGNHGAGVACGMRLLGISGIVFVPNHASPTKVAAIRSYGAEVRHYGDDGLDTELFARQYAEEYGMCYISPYNDLDVIAGQGTLGLEIIRQQPQLDAAIVAVGGGGLISGVATALKAANPQLTIVGASPANDDAMLASLRAGRIIEIAAQPTLSDGTAGGLEPDAVTFGLCQQLIDQQALVSETAIAAALRLALETHHQLLEGAAGTALAALLDAPQLFRGKRVAVVLCGANISLETLRRVLNDAA